MPKTQSRASFEKLPVDTKKLLLEGKLQDVKIDDIDTNGHNMHFGVFEGKLSMMARELSVEDIRMILDQQKAGVGEKTVSVELWGMCRCFTCGMGGSEPRLMLKTNGITAQVEPRCSHPGGVGTFSFELNVPSGVFVIGNDFRGAFKTISDYSVDTEVDRMKRTLAYADRIGLAHAFVQQSYPSVFKMSPRKFLLGVGRPVPKGTRSVGTISTDYSWFSVADGDDYCRRYGIDRKELRRHARFNEAFVVTCDPGVYCFHHRYFEVTRKKEPKVAIYTEWGRVRKPDPVRDFKGEFEALDYTAEAVIGNRYRGNYYRVVGNATCPGNPELGAIMRAADQLFCTLGAGVEVHPNGWLSDRPETDPSKTVEIPVFTEPFDWYGLDEGSLLTLCCGLGKETGGRKGATLGYKLNPSFANLAFNILQNIILVPPANRSSVPRDRKPMIKWAKKCIVALSEKHEVPDFAKEAFEVAKK